MNLHCRMDAAAAAAAFGSVISQCWPLKTLMCGLTDKRTENV